MTRIILTVAGTTIAILCLLLWGSYNQVEKLEAQLADEKAKARLIVKQYDNLLVTQETTDKEAQNEIQALRTKLANIPVRVRVVTKTIPATTNPSTEISTTSPTQTDWVLPERNSQELKRVIDEMEQINAAYASCRNTLLTANVITGSSGDPPITTASDTDILATNFTGE